MALFSCSSVTQRGQVGESKLRLRRADTHQGLGSITNSYPQETKKKRSRILFPVHQENDTTGTKDDPPRDKKDGEE